MYSAEQMYIHCGDQASNKQKYGAEEMASILMEKRGLQGEPLKLYQSEFGGQHPPSHLYIYSPLRGVMELLML